MVVYDTIAIFLKCVYFPPNIILFMFSFFSSFEENTVSAGGCSSAQQMTNDTTYFLSFINIFT